MRNLLALAGLTSVIFLGLGWYLGWYKIQNASSPDGRHHIQIDVDADKVKSDVSKGESRLHDILTDEGGVSQNDKNPPSGQSGAKGATTSFSTTQDGGFIFPASGPTPPTNGPLVPPAR
jgi:hypothetical protein